MSVLGAWSQTVTMGTVSDAAVSDLTVREQSRAPITDIQFTVEDAPATRSSFDAALIDADVTVQQSNNGRTRTWNAKIVRFEYQRGANYTQKRVRCETLETLAKRRRIFGEYYGSVDDVVRSIWSEWGTYIVPNTNVENLTDSVTIKPAWDSLFDALDEIARRFDYAWNIDKANDELVFFDPTGRTSPDIVQSNQDIIGKTASIKRSGEDIVNAVLASGWIYRRITESINMPTGNTIFSIDDIGCRRGIHSDQLERLLRQDEWEVVEAIITDDFAVAEIADKREAEVRDDGWIFFDPGLIPGIQAPAEDTKDGMRVDFAVDIRLRKRGQTLVTNDASISKYGRRDGEPITEDGGQTLAEARQRANIVVNARAWPVIEADMDLTAIGPSPDTVQRLTMYDPVIDRDMYVESVDHTTRGNELNVSVSLSTEDPD